MLALDVCFGCLRAKRMLLKISEVTGRKKKKRHMPQPVGVTVTSAKATKENEETEQSENRVEDSRPIKPKP